MNIVEMSLEDVKKELLIAKTDLDYVKSLLQEAGNELCYQCGRYHYAHEGVCDDCRWKNVKNGEMPT